MNLVILPHSKNYTGTVVSVKNLEPVESLNNLVRTSFFGFDVLVGKDTKIGDVGIFFPSETKLSDKFLSANNLYRHEQLNIDKTTKGYFEDSGRVKAVKFKGVNSSGFFIPISSLYPLFSSVNLKEGDEFNSIDGVLICEKYIRPSNKIFGESNKPKSTAEELVNSRCFKEHVDTEHLFRNLDNLKLDDLVSITIKVHGTSGRTGYQPVTVDKPQTWWQRLLRRPVEVEEKYAYVHASRRQIKEIAGIDLGKAGYYTKNLWSKAGSLFEGKLHKGETVYYEIIGWDGEKPIQPKYTYGISKGAFKVLIYRISFTNSDGITQDLHWSAVEERAKELGVPTVECDFFGKLSATVNPYASNWQELLQRQITNGYLDKPSRYTTKDWKMPEEGIVLTVYQFGQSKFYKAKAPSFLQHESKAVDKGEVDVEEVESV